MRFGYKSTVGCIGLWRWLESLDTLDCVRMKIHPLMGNVEVHA